MSPRNFPSLPIPGKIFKHFVFLPKQHFLELTPPMVPIMFHYTDRASNKFCLKQKIVAHMATGLE